MTRNGDFDFVALGEAIVRERKANELTQNELAERSGIDRKVIGRIELAQIPHVRLETVHRIAQGMGATLAQLLDVSHTQTRQLPWRPVKPGLRKKRGRPRKAVTA